MLKCARVVMVRRFGDGRRNASWPWLARQKPPRRSDHALLMSPGPREALNE
jgi:hypothetical protein